MIHQFANTWTFPSVFFFSTKGSNPRGRERTLACPVNMRAASVPMATVREAEEAACEQRAAGGRTPDAPPSKKPVFSRHWFFYYVGNIAISLVIATSCCLSPQPLPACGSMPFLPRTSARLLRGIIPPDRHSVPATARRPKYAPHAPTSYPAALPDQPARSRLHRVFHPQKAGYLLSFSMLFASSHCVFFHPPIVHFTALPFSIAQRKPSV